MGILRKLSSSIFSSNWGHLCEQQFIFTMSLCNMVEVVLLIGAVSVLTIAVMDAIRLTLGQIFSLVDGF